MLIKRFPGTNLNTIKKNLQKGAKVIEWHVGVLLKFGCIQQVTHKNSNLFSVSGLSQEKVLLAFIMRKELAYKILKKLTPKSYDIYELENELQETRANVQYCLNNLLDLSFICVNQEEQKTAGSPRYVVANHIKNLLTSGFVDSSLIST